MHTDWGRTHKAALYSQSDDDEVPDHGDRAHLNTFSRNRFFSTVNVFASTAIMGGGHVVVEDEPAERAPKIKMIVDRSGSMFDLLPATVSGHPTSSVA